jgi:FkbM family methyltransferase
MQFEYEGVSVLVPEDYPAWLVSNYARGVFYEHEMLHHIRLANYQGTYVDVGANAGNHSLFFAKFCNSTKVHAFEPNAIVHANFKALIKLNHCDEKTEFHPIGLASVNGEIEATFVIRNGVPNWTAVVPARRLDDVVGASDIAVIKIDVEGLETEVLGGAHRILTECKPALYIEARTETDRIAIEAAVAEYGYVPTGKVFNATPTYEYVVPAR